MSDFSIVNWSTYKLLTTTRSVRKRLDPTKPVPVGVIRRRWFGVNLVGSQGCSAASPTPLRRTTTIAAKMRLCRRCRCSVGLAATPGIKSTAMAFG
jgi:hypothetical protein